MNENKNKDSYNNIDFYNSAVIFMHLPFKQIFWKTEMIIVSRYRAGWRSTPCIDHFFQSITMSAFKTGTCLLKIITSLSAR